MEIREERRCPAAGCGDGRKGHETRNAGALSSRACRRRQPGRHWVPAQWHGPQSSDLQNAKRIKYPLFQSTKFVVIFTIAIGNYYIPLVHFRFPSLSPHPPPPTSCSLCNIQYPVPTHQPLDHSWARPQSCINSRKLEVPDPAPPLAHSLSDS